MRAFLCVVELSLRSNLPFFYLFFPHRCPTARYTVIARVIADLVEMLNKKVKRHRMNYYRTLCQDKLPSLREGEKKKGKACQHLSELLIARTSSLKIDLLSFFCFSPHPSFYSLRIIIIVCFKTFYFFLFYPYLLHKIFFLSESCRYSTSHKVFFLWNRVPLLIFTALHSFVDVQCFFDKHLSELLVLYFNI